MRLTCRHSLAKTYIDLKLASNFLRQNSNCHIIMFVADIAKRYYYNNGYRNTRWHNYRWLLWLLVCLPVLLVLILFFLRRRRSNRQVTVQPNNQYYQTQQAGGYYNGQQNGGYYGQQDGGAYGQNEYPPSQPGYGGNYQQGYARETEHNVTGDDFSRPDGPPPAHYKS